MKVFSVLAALYVSFQSAEAQTMAGCEMCCAYFFMGGSQMEDCTTFCQEFANEAMTMEDCGLDRVCHTAGRYMGERKCYH
eukprot:snap_masked-scaffold_2-processed-gene-24.25-mRNA-1 protein AED:1.00 eAED:1.00 QI:0/-1/0/0/-1/1/1/0/79